MGRFSIINRKRFGMTKQYQGLPRYSFVCGGRLHKIRFVRERKWEVLVDSESFPRVYRYVWVCKTLLARSDYAWARGLVNPSLSKIGRYLVSSKWEETFSCTTTFTLPILYSDHFPKLLDC